MNVLGFLLLVARVFAGAPELPPVAHALGSPDGQAVYCDCLEGFERSYALGLRWFEVDLVALKDGTILAAHDGDQARYPGLADGGTWADVTREELGLLDGRWHPLDLDELAVLMREHPDAHLIIDGKTPQRTNLAAWGLFKALGGPERIHPHVYSPEHRESLSWPTSGWVAAAYFKGWGERGEGLATSGADYVMAWPDWITEVDHPWRWAHTVNDPAEVLRLRALGVGVYSDVL